MKRKLYQIIAAKISAADRGSESAKDDLNWISRNLLPHGSGFDNGTSIATISTSQKIRFETSFHHMNDAGFYDGWTDHEIIIVPSFVHGFEMRVLGRDRNMVKDYIAEVFSSLLNDEYEEKWDKATGSTFIRVTG